MAGKDLQLEKAVEVALQKIKDAAVAVPAGAGLPPEVGWPAQSAPHGAMMGETREARMSHFSAAMVVVLAAGLGAAAGPGVAAAHAAPAQADRDLQEVQSYRLSMDVVRKLAAVHKAAAAAQAKDPRQQMIAKKKAELKALESKEEPTQAEQERMATLTDEIQRLEESADSGVTLEGATTLSELARRLDGVPAFAAAVRGAGMTTREFATAQLALLQTGIAYALLKSSPGQQPPPGVSKDNLEFMRLHEQEIEALRGAWDEDPAAR